MAVQAMSLMNRLAALVLVLLLGGLLLACDLVDSSGEVMTGKLRVDPGPDPTIQDFSAARDAAIRYAHQADSVRVAQAVIDELGLERSARDLHDDIGVDVDEDSLTVTIEVRDKDLEAGRVIAVALGNEMIERVAGILVEASDERESATIHSLVTWSDEQKEPIWRCIPAIPASCVVTSTDTSTTSSNEPTQPAVVRYRLVWLEKPAAP